MTTTVKAIFEGGLLRPLAPLGLSEGEEVDMTVRSRQEVAAPTPEYIEQLLAEFSADYETKDNLKTGSTAPDPKAAEILAAIAAMSVEPQDGPETGSIDHDKILYGEHGAR